MDPSYLFTQVELDEQTESLFSDQGHLAESPDTSEMGEMIVEAFHRDEIYWRF